VEARGSKDGGGVKNSFTAKDAKGAKEGRRRNLILDTAFDQIEF
jgi:hypothetical protein